MLNIDTLNDCLSLSCRDTQSQRVFDQGLEMMADFSASHAADTQKGQEYIEKCGTASREAILSMMVEDLKKLLLQI